VSPELEREVSEIYREHAGGLLRYARTVARDADEARDAVQECFLRYCLERYFGRPIDTPRAWLFQVLRNHLLTKWNSAAETREVASAELDTMGDERSNPENLANREQQARAIRRRLTDRELECLRLRAEGLSYAEIGQLLDIRSGTVGALLARATDKLKWPPGRDGTVGLGTAEAVHSLFLDAANGGGSPVNHQD
jgi:RNA polymerase sigma-70 factor (ECF subfamily)